MKKGFTRQNFVKQNLRGFTLIEFLVVMSIILLLSAIILPSYQQKEKLLALQRSAAKLAQDLRRAQELAMSSKDFHYSIPQGGYGIYFNIKNPDHYILFADCDGKEDYDGESLECPDCSETPCFPGQYPEKVGALIKFEKGIFIQKLLPIDPLDSFLTIIFTPPNPTIKIKPEPEDSTASITLSNNGKTKTVTINKAGLIEIK